jgi:hypothetical protein
MNTFSTDFDFSDDLGAGAATPSSQADIIAAAHIVNGGTATFPCPSCRGTGRFRTYSGRDGGECFKCKGRGNVSKGVIAAAKGKETKAANQAQWRADHAAEITYVTKRANKGSTFYAGFLDNLATYGSWTEKQLGIIASDMAKDAEFFAARKAQDPKSGSIGVERINALFATALQNGLKKPVFRTEFLTIKPAKAHPGTLYVMDKRIPNDGPYGGQAGHPAAALRDRRGSHRGSREVRPVHRLLRLLWP